MKAATPYCRVYYSIVDDERFVGVYDTPHLATWLRLLLIADAMWPATAVIPVGERASSVKALADRGIVELIGSGRFRMHGLDSERNRRSDAARESVGHRRDRSNNDRSTTVVRPYNDRSTSRDETSKAEPSTPAPAREGLPNINSTVAGIWETATGHTLLASTPYAQERLDDMCRRHPPSEVGASILRARQSFGHIPEDRALIVAMLKLLDPISREAPVPARRPTGKADPAVLRGRHVRGDHIDRDPECPLCAEAAS